MANHSSILSTGIPWTVWKGKRHDTRRWAFQVQYATGEEQRAINNSSRKNEVARPKQKWHSVVDVSAGESKVQCFYCALKEKYCIRTWHVRSISTVQFSCSVMSDSLQVHGLQHARLPCSSPTPKLCSNSCALSQWLPPNHLILCRPLLLPFSMFPSIRVFSNESILLIRWPKYWIFSFSISPSNKYSGLVSFRMDWLDHLEVQFSSVQFSSVAQSCPTLCDPMNHSRPGLPVHHQLLESTQTHVQWVSDAIQPSHPLSSPSPPASNPSQHQGLFQWVNSSHDVAKVLEFQLQCQSFQWTPRTDLL